MEVALGIVFGLLMAATALLAVLFRYAEVFPRFGRWLAARVGAVSPRIGQLLSEEYRTPDDDADAISDATTAAPPGAPDESAFGR